MKLYGSSRALLVGFNAQWDTAGMSHQPTAREEVFGALERTVGRAAARIEFHYEMSFDFDMSKSRSIPRQDGSLLRRSLRRLGPALSRLVMWGVPRLMRRWSPIKQRAVGVMDFGAHRCMYSYPHESRDEGVLVVGDRHWRGAPGAAVATISDDPAIAIQPVWLFDLVRGVVDAHEQAAQHLDGRKSRRFAAHADLNRVAEAVSYRTAIPPAGVSWLDDLARIPVDVWLDDDGHIRRVRHTSGGPHAPTAISTLDLTELGIEPPSDWSHLPAGVGIGGHDRP